MFGLFKGRRDLELVKAAGEGNWESVRRLLDKGADINAKTEDGWTALMVASRDGHTEVVKLLLDNGADVNAKNKDGRTALMLASFKGRTQVVKLLLHKGADVHAKDKDGKTALNYALQEGHTEVVKLLSDKGTDVHTQNGIATTAAKPEEISQDPALEKYNKWITACEENLRRTGSPEDAAELAINLKAKGVYLGQRGRAVEAVAEYRKAREILEPLVVPGEVTIARSTLAGVYMSEANALATDINDYENALVLYNKVIELLKSVDEAKKLGHCYFKEASTLEQLVEKDPEQRGQVLVAQLARALAYRAETKRRLGRSDSVNIDIQEAMKILKAEIGRTQGQTKQDMERLIAWIHRQYNLQ